MLKLYLILTFVATIVCSEKLSAQKEIDSTLEALQEIPGKYLSSINKKADKYSNQISNKTLKTVEKLSRWENKIKATLQKVNPEAANKLFGNNQLTFESLLQKIKQGESIKLQYNQQYDKYRDELTTNMKYLEKQKAFLDSGLAKKVKATKQKIQNLNQYTDSTDAIEQFIKERKKQLINESFNILGKNKYLSKMNKEVYYYSESLRNYKEIFNDSKKSEAAAVAILSNIPAYRQFFQQNSMLASLFGTGAGSGSSPSLEGLQTRSEISSIIQGQISAGGPNAQSMLQQNIQAAKEQLNTIKSKLTNLGSSGADVDERLGTFKPNTQKSKTFLQRLELGTNFQSLGSNGFFPTTTDIAVTAAYKFTDKASIGLGTSYKLGWGNSIDNIKMTTQGIGFRSFAEYKIKGNFYAGGGFEYNYQKPVTGFIREFRLSEWQQSGLAGISKTLPAKSKLYKQTKVQLFWDFLSYSQLPKTSPIKFRVGYVF